MSADRDRDGSRSRFACRRRFTPGHGDSRRDTVIHARTRQFTMSRRDHSLFLHATEFCPIRTFIAGTGRERIRRVWVKSGILHRDMGVHARKGMTVVTGKRSVRSDLQPWSGQLGLARRTRGWDHPCKAAPSLELARPGAQPLIKVRAVL